MDKLIQELKKEGVLQTPRIEAALRAVDRADFVPAERKKEAYGNYPLPIGYKQTISQPLTVVFMLELLDPQPGDTVLEVGAGSGWQTALLAHLVSTKKTGKTPDVEESTEGGGKTSGVEEVGRTKEGYVVAVERIKELAQMAENNIEKYDFAHVEVVHGDGTQGYKKQAPYDKIIAAASAKEVPSAWKKQLSSGGTMVFPLERSVYKITKQKDNTFIKEEYHGFVFVPLRYGTE